MDAFGRITLGEDYWHIECEPHVRARLKRVFPRVHSYATSCIRLSRTPENSRELLWFLQRYPMLVDQLELMEEDSRIHLRSEKRLSALLSNTEPPPLISLAAPARDYQAVVPEFLDIKDGLLLGDDLGTGKTVSALCCLTHPRRLPCVIVMPPALTSQWIEQLRRFTPELSTYVVKDGNVIELDDLRPQRKKRPSQPMLLPGRLPDVILISYFLVHKWSNYLARIVKLAIFEEAQQLCRPDSKIYTGCKEIAAAATQRLGLSGTPVGNYGNDFHHLAEILIPGCLGSYEEFLTEWCTKNEAGHMVLRDSRQFGAYIRREGIMLRRTREEVGRELPKLTKIIQEITPDASVLNKLTGNAIELAKVILSRDKEAYAGQRRQANSEFDLVLRQATGISKAPIVANLVRLICESGEKVLLYGWHRAVYEIWLEKLKDLNPLMYTGSENNAQKAANLKAFIEDDKHRVLIMSVRSGVGVDGIQQACRVTVTGELDWSAARTSQNIGRVHRDGQENETLAYFCVADDGSDPIMSAVLGIKREQLDGVRDPDAFLIEKVDDEENNIKELARQFLMKRGIEMPKEELDL